MFRKYVIPMLAVAGLAFAIYTVRSEGQPRPVASPVAEPARSPFAAAVAGSGIIEASTQNIAVGTNIPGIVAEVFVKPGASVKAGDPLFRVDDRTLRAELASRRAAVAVAERQLARLRSMPRPEEIPPMEARVAEMSAMLEDMRSQLRIMESIADPRAVSQDELTRRRGAVSTAEARLQTARSELAQLKAGAWTADIAVAEAQLEQARAALAATETELDRLTVRASVAGEVLQVNIRVGEFAQAGPMATPLMLLGNTDVLHVRVDVDENDAWRVRPGAPAQIALRGNSGIRTGVEFVRIEPYVIPKRSLTGESTERVDTRVLQVLYRFPRGAINAYVGQLVDVHIQAEPFDPRSGTGPSPRADATR
jgi:multidrug resistance efflux pump